MMRSNSLALITAVALLANTLGIMSLAPSAVAAAPAQAPGPPAVGALPAWFTAVPDGPDQSADPETTTGADGRFHFEGLALGTHKVTLDPATLPLALRPAQGEAVPILWLTPGRSQTSEALSTGVRFTASYDQDGATMDGIVFVDLNDDGQAGADEPGIEGVRVVDPTLHEYLVPFDDRDLWEMFLGKASCHRDDYTACGPLISNVFLTAGSNGTTYYYDHWEDGYDADPLDPSPTTEVGVIDAGVTQLFQSDISISFIPWPAPNPPYYYDGRDRITIVGEAAQVVRLVNPSSFSLDGECPGEWNSSGWLASAWEVPEVAIWGSEYVAAVGEDLDFSAGDPDDHDFSGLEVMAWQDGTEVYYNGAPVTLNAGDVLFVDGANDGAGGGGVDSDDVITATAPIQVQMMTGACSREIVSAHGYTLQPKEKWGSNYWMPVPGFEESAYCIRDAGDVDTDIYIHNPNPYEITVSVSSNLGADDILVPANTSTSVLFETSWEDVSTGNQGMTLTSPETFWGLVAVDSATNRATGGEATYGDDYDWGFSLIPACECSSQVVVGYAPGPSTTPPFDDNGSMAFVTAITDTVIFVDLNQDGLPDPFDMNGNGNRDDLNIWGEADWNEPLSALGVRLSAGQIMRVGDPDDLNLMGARIYTKDLGETIAVAWGQDPCRANLADYLDLGYTILPPPIPRLSKVDSLAVDADGSGDFSPGDTIEYTLVLNNNGQGAMTDVVLTDPLPYTYTDYVVGSLQVTTPPPVGALEYSNDGVNFGDPEGPDIQALRVRWPVVEAGRIVTITFQVTLHTDIPVGVTEISNQAVVESEQTTPRLSEDPDDPFDPDTDTPVQRPLLSIDKRVSPSTVAPGDQVTYTVVLSNYGNGVALLTQITDTLPTELEYIPGTLNLTWPVAQVELKTQEITETGTFNGFYADDFDLSETESTYYSGNDGSLSWSTDWTEVADDGLPGTGDVRVLVDGNALSEPSHAWMTDEDNIDSGLARVLDLSKFEAPRLRYYLFGNTDGAGNYRVEVTGVDDFVDVIDGGYTIEELDLTPAAGNPAVTLGFFATSGMDPGEFYRFDHISIYESQPQREVTRTLTQESTVLVYNTSVGGEPVSYNPLTGQMVITEGLRLPASGTVTATYQAQVPIPLPDGFTLNNTACTTATNWIEVLSPPCDDASVTVDSSHVLTITKVASPSPVGLGGQLTYTLQYTITGNEAVEGITVRDETPAGTTFVSATPTPSSAPPAGGTGTVIWELSGLWPPGSGLTEVTGTLTMVVQVDPMFGGEEIYNLVTISDTTGLTDTDEVTTPVEPSADMAIEKTDSPDPVLPGSLLTYTLTVRNNGPSEAENVVASDTLPAEVEFARADPTQTSGPNPLTWNLGNMASGEEQFITVVVTVTPDVTEPFTNVAQVGSDTSDPDLTNNQDEEPTRPPTPGLDLVKTADPSRTTPGMPFTYTLRIENTGDFTFEELWLTDTLPIPDFFYVDGSGSPTDPVIIAEPLLVWPDLVPLTGPLVPGDSLTVTYQVTTSLTSGTYTNTATVEGVYPGGTLTDTDDAPVSVVKPAAVVEKRLTGADNDNVAPNYITFTIAITNVGPSTIDVLPLLDEYDTFYLSFVDATPYPEEDEDDGLLKWRDLTGPGPYGFGNNLPPGETFEVTTVFRVVRDIVFTLNTAIITDVTDIYNNPADPDEDDEPVGGIPTAIEVLYFRAAAEESAVRLEWATAAEIDCRGFRVYRAPEPHLERAEAIAFIPAQGSRSTYTTTDRDVAPNQVYWYWLAEVSASDPEHETFHGPEMAGVGAHVLPVHLYLPVVGKDW